MEELEYTKETVKRILRNFHRLQKAAQDGNTDAIVTVVDVFHQALAKANLTNLQKEVIYYHFLMECSVKETAFILGVTSPMVVNHINSIVTKVTRILEGAA